MIESYDFYIFGSLAAIISTLFFPHFGNGWLGGFLPIIATSLVASTGNIYAGLAFPIVVALLTFVVGSITLRDRHNESIWAEVHNTGNPTVSSARPV